MKKLVIGILAHVDAGKTTLSESLLYLSGKIGRLGRVDKQNAYLDTDEQERARGITIFAKQAVFEAEHARITLVDTPGHVDFSAETERTLRILDYAVLVVSGSDGVQEHTRTLWQLLDFYRVPTFLFVNKMDQPGAEKDRLLADIQSRLSENCIDFSTPDTRDFYERLALCDEPIMERYLARGTVETPMLQKAIWERKLFPCFFGSALKLDGVDFFLRGMDTYMEMPDYREDFGARVFKISRDAQGERLTHLKITGGALAVREVVSYQGLNEKVNQLRVYSGEKYENLTEAGAGMVCAVTGLTRTFPGEGLGFESGFAAPVLEPVLRYRILLPENCDPKTMLPKLRQLEEEEPELHIVWNEPLQEIQAQVMGAVQMEILQNLIEKRFGVPVRFSRGSIIYKETITAPVEGVGHFEPLRHYAEVHLLLEPGKPGSGLRFASRCSEDLLAKSWQRLILTHLREKAHKGVLTGSEITDMKITLMAGRAHIKHTEGGDFREATYRAVRQGLKQAESVLLEPYNSFRLEIPEGMVGRAMTDIETMSGRCEITGTNGGITVLTGTAPVAAMQNYQQEVTAYSRGQGRLFCSFQGYAPCHNAQEVIAAIGYDAERDLENPTGSVFCAHGAGFTVPWDEVNRYMHLESCLGRTKITGLEENAGQTAGITESGMSVDEIDAILSRASSANQGKKPVHKGRRPHRVQAGKPAPFTGLTQVKKEKYLLVDGYNVIYAWPELKELADSGNMEGARMKLLDLLSHYRSLKNCHVMAVFDAYRVQGHREEVLNYHNLQVVYTKEAQTADQYIEKYAYHHGKSREITVATSDGLQQIIIRGFGCGLLSSRELKAEIEQTVQTLREEYGGVFADGSRQTSHALPPEEQAKIRRLLEENPPDS